MAKGIDLGLAGPDDPIYSSGLQVHFKPPLTRSTGDTPKSTAGAPQPAPSLTETEPAPLDPNETYGPDHPRYAEAVKQNPMLPVQNGLEAALRKGLEEANPGMWVDPSTGELVPIASKP